MNGSSEFKSILPNSYGRNDTIYVRKVLLLFRDGHLKLYFI